MNIETRELEYSRKAFQKFLKALILRKTKNARIIILVFAIAICALAFFEFSISGSLRSLVRALLFSIVAAILFVVPFLGDPTRAQSKLNFQKQWWQVDDRFFCMFFEDGSLEKTHMDNFVKADKLAGYYALYLSKISFQYLPIAAFKTEADRQEFHDFLVSKGLLKA